MEAYSEAVKLNKQSTSFVSFYIYRTILLLTCAGLTVIGIFQSSMRQSLPRLTNNRTDLVYQTSALSLIAFLTGLFCRSPRSARNPVHLRRDKPILGDDVHITVTDQKQQAEQAIPTMGGSA